MKRILTCLVFTICCAFAAPAQDKNDKALKDAAKNATPLTVSTVNSDVSIEGVLIPRVDAQRIFGKEIANNYAVIELNIGNKSPDSALLVQGVYIDYSRWALSGFHNTVEPPKSRFGQYQTSNDPSHVASNEYRVVRGQLLDAQHSTWRNRVVDWLTFAVSLASGFDFAIKEQGIKTGFGKAGTIGLPALKTAWPDSTIEQLKTIDDYGFRSGKSIPREGSDIMICFFPIDRFLTPGFKKLYLKAPALFFVPGMMLVDKTMQKDVERALGSDLGMGVSISGLRKNLPCFEIIQNPKATGFEQCLPDFGLAVKKDAQKKWITREDGTPQLEVTEQNKFKNDFLPLAYLSQMTLNSITVTLDGVMTIDTSAFAAKLETIAFDKIDGCGDDTSSCFWTDTAKNGGVRTGTISGSYLTGGTVAIAEADPPKTKELTTVADGSNDQVIHFSFKLDQPIAQGSKLTFTVNKTQSGPNATKPKELKSAAKEYIVTYALADPTIDTKVTVNDSTNPVTVTLTGKHLSDPASTKPPKISIHSPGNIDVADVKASTANDTSITLALPADTQPVGCWSVTVKVGSKDVTQKFVVAPTITSAAISGTGDNKKLTITGTFLDAKDCQTSPKGLDFQLQIGNQLIPLTADQGTDKKVTIPLTGKAADAVPTWTLHIKFNGAELTHPPMQ